MDAITRIVVKESSGYCSLTDAYHDKLVINPAGISYEYQPEVVSEQNTERKWSYRTDSRYYKQLYNELQGMMPPILNPTEEVECVDAGCVEFIVTYSDKTKAIKRYLCSGYEFKAFFDVVRKVVPLCENFKNDG